MLLAIMVDTIRNQKVATFYRLVLLIPSMIPGPLIFVLWKWMYDLNIGPIDYLLVDRFHLFTIYTQPQWLGDPKLVFLALAIMGWWWGLGYHTMFYLAGLAAIPKDLIEAARVDGANEWRLFWNVTCRGLRPIMLVLVVLRFGTAMAVIDEYLILGGFNRTRPTYTWTVYMWETAFQIGASVPGLRRGDRLDRRDRRCWSSSSACSASSARATESIEQGLTNGRRSNSSRACGASGAAAGARRSRPIGWTIVRHVVLVLFVLIILLPLAWVLLLSVKSIPGRLSQRHLAAELRFHPLRATRCKTFRRCRAT